MNLLSQNGKSSLKFREGKGHEFSQGFKGLTGFEGFAHEVF